MSALRLLRLCAVAALALGATSAVAACTFTQDLEPLKNEDCGEGFKVCRDPADSITKCVNTNSPSFNCATDSCTPCVTLNATAVCKGGQCGIAACMPGFSNCDENETNGCELNTDFDKNNCGGCGEVCERANARTVCNAGNCRIDVNGCHTGFVDCNGAHADGCECNVGDGGFFCDEDGECIEVP